MLLGRRPVAAVAGVLGDSRPLAASTSYCETVLPKRFATYTLRPPGLIAMADGSSPAGTVGGLSGESMPPAPIAYCVTNVDPALATYAVAGVCASAGDPIAAIATTHSAATPARCARHRRDRRPVLA